MIDHDKIVENIHKLQERSAIPPGRVYDAIDDLIAAYDAKSEELLESHEDISELDERQICWRWVKNKRMLLTRTCTSCNRLLKNGR